MTLDWAAIGLPLDGVARVDETWMVVTMKTFPIVVGFDGSAGARAALRWALDEAAARTAPLRLAYVMESPPTTGSMLSMPFEYSDPAHRRHARSLLAAATEEAAGSHPAVDLRPDLLEGPTVATLCRLSETARLVVLGSRGLGGITGLFVGSIGVAVAANAHCPVVVLREGLPGGGPVAVGVDDSAQARRAAAFAFDEAAVRGADLVAVRAWTPPSMAGRSDVRPLTRDAAELETAEWHAFKEAIDRVAERHPSVAVTTRLIAGDARPVLTEASTGAQLLVVGSRGRGGFAGLILGSVSHHLLHHGHCPIAVMPPHARTA